MMQAMKGATMALGSMNRTMNLPSLQRIAMEFERENDIMEQRQEMMDDVMDDAMDVGLEEEGDEVVEQVLEEIGVDLSQSVGVLAKPETPYVVLILTLSMFSSARPRQDYSRMLCQKPRLLKQLAVVVVVAEPIPATMISKRGLIACDDECGLYSSNDPLRRNDPSIVQISGYRSQAQETGHLRTKPGVRSSSNLCRGQFWAWMRRHFVPRNTKFPAALGVGS
jgi:hypothetical protein